MNPGKLNNLVNTDTTKLYISIINCIEKSKNIKDFINETRRILRESGLPIFNLSLINNENKNEFILLNADLCKLNLKSTMSSDNESSELNIVRKIQLTEKNDYNENIILPVKNGIIIKTSGIQFDDKNLHVCEINKKIVIKSYFSLSVILKNLYDNMGLEDDLKDDDSGEIVIYPIKSDNNFIGTIDLFFSQKEKVLTQEETRQLVIISRIISYGYKNFLNIFRASTSESKFRAIFEFTPLAILVVNRDYQVIEINNRFKAWYPKYREDKVNTCYKVFPYKEKNEPCNQCIIRETFETGRGVSCETKSLINNKKAYFEIKTSPIYSESGEITAVMKTIEDITERVLADQQIKRKNKKLELAVTQKIEILKEKEKNLTSLVNSALSIRGSNSRKESIEKIIAGFIKLESSGVFFAQCENNELYLEKIYPEENYKELKKIFNIDLNELRININKNPDNPFVLSFNSANPIFFIGREGMSDFFKSMFPEASKKTITRALTLYKGLSLVVFPLLAKEKVEGVIAVLSDQEIMENNFEYYLLLSNSAALETNRLNDSKELINSEIKYRNLVENSRDMISICDKFGNIKFSNRTFWEKLGYEEDNKENLNIYEFFSSRQKLELKGFIESFIESRKKPEPVEILIGNTNANLFWTEMVINNISKGSPDLQFIFRDITDKKELDDKIERLSSFKKKILQNDYVGIITINLAGSIQSWNRGAENILGYTEKEVINKNINELIISGYEGNFSENKENKPDDQLGSEIVLMKKDEEPVSVMYIESLLRDQNNEPIKIIAFFFDVSEKVDLHAKSMDLVNQLSEAQKITIISLAKLAEYRDIETGTHLERIMKYTELLANELSTLDDYKDYISEDYITDLVNSSLLHDIGKVGIPDNILHKPSKLSKNEFEVMKNHSLIGGDTISDAERRLAGRSYLKLGKEVAYYHHEKWDGTGYPKGLKGDQIPLSARIVAVADVYDALRSKRPYKESFSHQKTMKMILDHSNTHFDATIVQAFINRQKEFESISKTATPN